MAFSVRLKAALDRAGLIGIAFFINNQLRVLRVRRTFSVPIAGEFADGLPLPPARLLVGIGGATTPAAYLRGGQLVAAAIRDVLRRHDIELERFGAILDFGCGCGRILRRFKDLSRTAELHGSDYDARQIAWCEARLPFGRFRTNGLQPPLSYADNSFDLVYAFSVFTHLPEELQVVWMRELRRVSRPNGYVLITVHSDRAALELSAQERERYRRGQLVVRFQSSPGTNLCAAFHSEKYIRNTLAEGWRFLDSAETEVGQKFVLLQKPG